MTTNLLAYIVVALATNVTERFPTHQESDVHPAVPGGFNDLLYYFKVVPDQDPQAKWVRTTVTESTQVEFELSGRRMTNLISSRVLSDTEVELHKRPYGIGILSTNVIGGTTYYTVSFDPWCPMATNEVPTHAELWDNKWVGTNLLSATNFFTHSIDITNRVKDR